MKRYAIYARYSTDLQNPKSAEDQIRECEEYVKKCGGRIVKTYKDEAISGDAKFRPQYQEMLEDMPDKIYDFVISESLSRFNRDNEALQYLFKYANFYESPLVTLVEGKVDEMTVGIKGTMNALYLRDGAKAVKRGMIGKIRDKVYVSSPPYGYKIDKTQYDEKGDRIKGILKIDEREEQIVCRIFEEYAAGKSSIDIARDLNKEGVVGIRGKKWRASAIHGNRNESRGIVNNSIYRGVIFWNKSKKITNPVTKKKVNRKNPESEWIREERPELSMISDNLWLSVKARQDEVLERACYRCKKQPLTGARRHKYLLSGLISCGECGDSYVMTSQGRYGCAGRRQGKGCTNAHTIRRDELERTVLACVSDVLLRPEMVAWFIEGYMEQSERLKKQSGREQLAIRNGLKVVEKNIESILQAIERGIITDSTHQRLLEHESKKMELETSLIPVSDISMPDKGIIDKYRQKVMDLSESIYDTVISSAARRDLRSLIESITLYPHKDGLKAKVYGNIHHLTSIDEDNIFF